MVGPASTLGRVRTRFTELVGCRLPFQLAVLGGVGTTGLAAAVIDAGGLGMVPHGVPPPQARPCGVGFLVPFVPPPGEVTEAARGIAVAEFFWGRPDPDLVRAAHAGGALASWQVGSVDEARTAEAAGCDLVVAQGVEAGGHVRGTTPLDRLLAEVLSAVGVPVVAAGGIGSAARVAGLLASGADGVRVGTRFLVAPECNAHPAYVDALIAAGPEDTVLTEHFDEDGHWPGVVRVLRASLQAAERAGNRSSMPPRRRAERPPMDMACYAGSSVGDAVRVQPAAEVVAELTAQLR